MLKTWKTTYWISGTKEYITSKQLIAPLVCSFFFVVVIEKVASSVQGIFTVCFLSFFPSLVILLSLVVDSQLYKTLCPFICLSVHPLVLDDQVKKSDVECWSYD